MQVGTEHLPLEVGTLRTLALATVLQAALTWFPGVTPHAVPEAENAHDDTLFGDLDSLGGGCRLAFTLGSVHVSGARSRVQVYLLHLIQASLGTFREARLGAVLRRYGGLLSSTDGNVLASAS